MTHTSLRGLLFAPGFKDTLKVTETRDFWLHHSTFPRQELLFLAFTQNTSSIYSQPSDVKIFQTEKPINGQNHLGWKILRASKMQLTPACQAAEPLLGLFGQRVWLLVKGPGVTDRLVSWEGHQSCGFQHRMIGHCAAVELCINCIIPMSLFPHLQTGVNDDIYLQNYCMKAI